MNLFTCKKKKTKKYSDLFIQLVQKQDHITHLSEKQFLALNKLEHSFDGIKTLS